MSASKTILRRPGVEAGSTAWKATMLTVTPQTPVNICIDKSEHYKGGTLFDIKFHIHVEMYFDKRKSHPSI